MCLLTNGHKELKITKRTIPVDKILLKQGNKYYSPYHKDFLWILEKIMKSNIKINHYHNQSKKPYTKISIGLHSIKPNTPVQGILSTYLRTKRLKAHIPKGAHYLYDPKYKKYVSNQLIVHEPNS